MKANVGTIDRLLRLLVAAGPVYLFFTGERPNWEYGALAVGVILGLTSVAGFCPLYRLVGVDTSRKKTT